MWDYIILCEMPLLLYVGLLPILFYVRLLPLLFRHNYHELLYYFTWDYRY